MSIGNAGSNTTTASNAEVSNLLVQGFKAAKEGRRDEAYDIFCDVVRRDPNNELGWLYRAATTQDLSEAYVCLQRVLNINPANEKAERGVERIQNRLSTESNNRRPLSNAGPAIAAAATPPIGTREVISDFNSSFARSSEPDTAKAPNQTTRYPYQEAASPFNQTQPAPTDENAAPPPYRPDFGQLNTPGAIGKLPTAQIRSPRPTPPAYVPAIVPASQDAVGPDNDMVDEPVYTGPVGSQPESSNSRRAFLVGGLASARQRGRAAFGGDTPTDLDQNGQRRSRQVLIPLVVLGIILVIAALIVLLLPVFNKNSNETATNVAVAPATTSAAILNTPVSTSTPGNKPATTSASAVTVQVVGATTAAAQTSEAATTAPATIAPVVTTAAPPTAAPTTAVVTTAAPTVAPTTAPAPTQAPAPTAVPPTATPPPPPPATAAPVAPALPRATVYVIKSGDNLTRIATQYSTSIEAIQAANPGLQQNTIFAGNRIVVPVSRPTFRGRGAIMNNNENLETIANRYKVNVDDLARFNGYGSPADAKPGDAILIP